MRSPLVPRPRRTGSDHHSLHLRDAPRPPWPAGARVRAERCDAVALNVASTTAATTSGRTARGPLGHQSTAPAALNVGYPQTSGPCPRRRRLRTAVRRTSYCGESIGPRRCGGPRARRAPNWTSFCRRAWTPPKRCRASVGADRCNVVRRRCRVRSCLWPRPAWLWRRLNRRRRRRGLVKEALLLRGLVLLASRV